VELDCWDGPAGEPIIYHGGTLTSKIMLRDVIEAIRNFGFSTSPYPVILSVENHCSPSMQDTMVAILTETFKDMLFVPTPEQRESWDARGYMPSPDELRYKVLLKGKVRRQREEDEVEEDDDDDDDDSPDVRRSPPLKSGKTLPRAAQGRSTFSVKEKKRKDANKQSKERVTKKLSDLFFFQGVKFQGFNHMEETYPSPTVMSSLNENKMLRAVEHASTEFVQCSSFRMCRVYPAAIRIDSSNFSPMPAWNSGVQLCALNYQTFDLHWQVNFGKFQENGASGYLLKPQYLRHGYHRGQTKGDSSNAPAAGSPLPPRFVEANSPPFTTPDNFVLMVRVISAQQLPKPGGALKGEVIDPLVQLQMHGITADSVMYKTSTVTDNGLNPLWDEEFSFRLRRPEVAILTIHVYDDETLGADRFVGFSALPVSCIQEGYRTVPLYSASGRADGEFEFASVFCHFSFSAPLPPECDPRPKHGTAGNANATTERDSTQDEDPARQIDCETATNDEAVNDAAGSEEEDTCDETIFDDMSPEIALNETVTTTLDLGIVKAFTLVDPTHTLPEEVGLLLGANGCQLLSLLEQDTICLWPWESIKQWKADQQSNDHTDMELLGITITPPPTTATNATQENGSEVRSEDGANASGQETSSGNKTSLSGTFAFEIADAYVFAAAIAAEKQHWLEQQPSSVVHLPIGITAPAEVENDKKILPSDTAPVLWTRVVSHPSTDKRRSSQRFEI